MTLEAGYIDFHVHVGERIAGIQLRDDFKALNKLTERDPDPENPPLAGIGVFVTESPGESLEQKLELMQKQARQDFNGLVQWHLTPITANLEEIYPILKEGNDLKFYTTYRQAGLYRSYEEIGRWMKDLKELKTRILVHCEDDNTISQYSEQHPFRHPHDHCLRRPELAETRAVERILDLAVQHQHPVHIVHVSSPASAQLIKEARQHYQGITCETAPHYLLQNEDSLKTPDAHRSICTPPFRSERSRGMLVEHLQDGVFDILASDHCAFTDADKDRFQDELEKVPNGIPGVKTLFTSVYRGLVQTGKLSLEALQRMTMLNPRFLMSAYPKGFSDRPGGSGQ
ncbi:MAG TPA: dihydroorotase family protein [Candidatus Cloacimonadota bacterium]|nr:dihydroorotase family protein [Candidatus Cloacimonadota bacterium]